MPFANRNTIRATIEGRLATELASSPTVPVVFNNVVFKPTPNTSWVQCQVSFGDSDNLTLQGDVVGDVGGDNLLTGLLLVNIFTPANTGTSASLVLGKRIRDLYNRINVSDIYFDAPIGPMVVNSTLPDGFYQTQVRATFEFIEEL
jgi:hypothetical protein